MKLRTRINCLLGRHARAVMTLTERAYGFDRLFTIVYCPHCLRLLLIARANPEPADTGTDQSEPRAGAAE